MKDPVPPEGCEVNNRDWPLSIVDPGAVIAPAVGEMLIVTASPLEQAVAERESVTST